jgi:hypothetical protein
MSEWQSRIKTHISTFPGTAVSTLPTRLNAERQPFSSQISTRLRYSGGRDRGWRLKGSLGKCPGHSGELL